MKITLEHDDATILVEELNPEFRGIKVTFRNPATYSQRTRLMTHYPLELIKAVLEVKSPAWLCDEIARDEDPTYVEGDLLASLFSYVPGPAFQGKRLLDFGCGAGASTMILARALPHCEIIGVELNGKLLDLARRRADHYQLDNLTLLQSPAADRLPAALGDVDFVVLSAVFEHLLPAERPALLGQMWSLLRQDGVLFINQTPDRRFPLETHTTGLPLINYLSDRPAHRLACRWSPRVSREASWASLLKDGIRGGTPNEVMACLRGCPGAPELLQPRADGIRRQSDIWYRTARERWSRRQGGLKGKAVLAAMSLIGRSRIPVAPYLSLAVRKTVSSPGSDQEPMTAANRPA